MPLGANGILGIVYAPTAGKTTNACFDVGGYFVYDTTA